MCSTATRPVIGILYPGDMGAHLGKLFRQKGHRVVTTVAGRSARTRGLARRADLEIVASLDRVVESADILLSLVPPTGAVALAAACRACPATSDRQRLFVDLNSIAPDTARRVESVLAGSALTFVDGAVHGVASQLCDRGVVYLSGPEAQYVAPIFPSALRVKVVSDRPGDASAIRMMFSGLTKGLVALFLEMTLVARTAGFLDQMVDCYQETYPALMTLIERLLPSYPLHAARRGDELREVEQTMSALGLEPCLVTAAREIISAVGRMQLEDTTAPWSVEEVIEAVYARNPLQTQTETAVPLAAPRIEPAVVSTT